MSPNPKNPPITPALYATLTQTQLAEVLQVSTKTIDRMRQDGRLPPPLPLGGRTLRWRRSDLQHILPAV